jgi:gas vesicle protein
VIGIYYIGRRDREEMEMRLRRVERQVRNKSQGVLEMNNRISEVEYNEEIGDDSMNASIGEAQDFAQKTVDEEVVELKRKVEELEEKLTRNFHHLDNRIKTVNSDIGDLNHRLYDMTHYRSRQSPSQEAVYVDQRVGELRIPISENLDDNHQSRK